MNTRILWIFIFIPLLSSAIQPWTSLLRKNFSQEECVAHKNKKQLLFTRTEGLFHFTQLVPSWCALKPSEGYFEFSVQVRDAQTQQWYEWHHMIDWGAKVQKSYSNTSPLGTRYCHVRLELPQNHYADAFRIRVIAYEDADLSLIKSLAVNIADLHKFNEVQSKDSKNLTSYCVPSIPEQSQMILNHPKADCMCSPTSCFMLTSYINQLLGNTMVDPLHVAESVYDYGLQAYGSWPFNTAYCFQLCKGALFFRVARLNSFADLHRKLKQNMPVVVSVRGKLNGAPKEYSNGHLLLVRGWNKETQKVICHDPAFASNQEVYVEYDIDAFCTAWGRSYNLAYIPESVGKETS